MNGDIEREPRRCPSDTDLRMALQEPGDLSLMDSIEAHIQICHSCQQRLARLTDDPLMESFKGAPSDGRPGPIAPLLRRLKALDPSRDGATNVPDHPDMDGVTFPGAPTPDAPLGRLEQFEIVEQIGSGGAGLIDRAIDTSLGRTVAIKVLRPHIAATVAGRARFEREARLSARVRHENVVSILWVGEASATTQHSPLVFIAMEYVDGDSLAALRRRHGRLPPADTCRIMRQVALGLSAAHEQGLVHRDLKPSNILVERGSGRARLTDFGIARAYEGDSSGNDRPDRVTSTGQLLGTWEYMSPEQFDDPRAVDWRSDIFGVGVVLYELVTGQRPFQGSRPEVIRKIMESEPRRPSQVVGRLPNEIDSIVLKCLDKEPARRYQTAEALAEDLGRWLVGEPIQAKRPSPWSVCWKWTRRRPGLAAAIGLLFMSWAILSVVIITANIRLRESGQRLERALDSERSILDQNLTILHARGISGANSALQRGDFLAAMHSAMEVPVSRQGLAWQVINLQLGNAPRPARLLGNHDWPITSLVVDTPRRRAYTAGQDGQVIGIDLEAGGMLRQYEKGVEFSQTKGLMHALLRNAEEAKQSKAPIECVFDLCLIDTGRTLVGCTSFGRLIAWDVESGARSVLLERDVALLSIAATKDGSRLLVGDERGTVLTIKLDGSSKTRVSLPTNSPVMDVAWLDAGRWIAVQHDGTLSVLEAEPLLLTDKTKVRDPTWGVATRADGLIAVAAAGGILPTFRWRDDKKLLVGDSVFVVPLIDGGHESPDLQLVRFTPDGSGLYAADSAGRLLKWSVSTGHLEMAVNDQIQSRLEARAAARDLPATFRKRMGGIEFDEASQTLYTAGSDLALKEWYFPKDNTTIRFQVGSDPKVIFDQSNPSLLWVGAGDGTVSLWDTLRGERVDSMPAHEGPVTAIASDAGSSVVATCGVDRTIRLHRRVGRSIERFQGPFVCESDPISVSLDPQGKLAAVYTKSHRVEVWNIEAGNRQVTRVDDEISPNGKGGIVGFNSDGTRLAVLPQGPKSTLFDVIGDKIAKPHTTYLSSTDGCTAAAWHPTMPRVLFVGDTESRIRGTIELRNLSLQFGDRLSSEIVGLSWVPGTNHMAVGMKDGTVILYDQIGPTLTLRSGNADANGALVDPPGKRILASHKDGLIHIWESEVPQRGIPAVSPRAWIETRLLEEGEAHDLALRSASATLDPDGRVVVIYAEQGRGEARDQNEVWLGHEGQNGLRRSVIGSAGDRYRVDTAGAQRSLAVLMNGDEVVSVYREREGTGNDGQLVMSRHRLGRDDAGLNLREAHGVFNQPANWGFDTHLSLDASRFPQVLHYAHDYRRLMITRWSGQGWETDQVGRHGDGYKVRATSGRDGDVLAVSMPLRFGGDIAPTTVLRVGDATTREIIDPTAFKPGDQADRQGICAGDDGRPIVLHSRLGARGWPELLLSRQTPGGWVSEVVSDVAPKEILNLARDRTGGLWFTYTTDDNREVYVASNSSGNWRAERVWADPSPRDPASQRHSVISSLVLIDAQNQPVVLVWEYFGPGWLKALRPNR